MKPTTPVPVATMGSTRSVVGMPNSLAAHQPLWSFVLLAYLWSWTFWGIAAFVPGLMGEVAHYAGGLGPLVAAMAVECLRGDSTLAWFKGLFKWRLNPLWFLFAPGFPVLQIAVMSLAYAMLGHTLDSSLIPRRLAAYIPTFAILVAIGGGNEEPGWRGFGLPELQRVHGPMRSTMILGAIWAVCDSAVMSGSVPLNALATTVIVIFVSISTHAFWYTWLINRTGSVLLCILLHGSYDTANGLLLLVPESQLEAKYPILLTLMTSVLIGSVLFLILITRGQLGRRRTVEA